MRRPKNAWVCVELRHALIGCPRVHSGDGRRVLFRDQFRPHDIPQNLRQRSPQTKQTNFNTRLRSTAIEQQVGAQQDAMVTSGLSHDIRSNSSRNIFSQLQAPDVQSAQVWNLALEQPVRRQSNNALPPSTKQRHRRFSTLYIVCFLILREAHVTRPYRIVVLPPTHVPAKHPQARAHVGSVNQQKASTARGGHVLFLGVQGGEEQHHRPHYSGIRCPSQRSSEWLQQAISNLYR